MVRLVFSCCLLLGMFNYGSPASRPRTINPRDQSTPKDRDNILQMKNNSMLLEQRHPDSAIALVRKGLSVSRHLHYRYGEAMMIASFAAIHEKYGNLSVALKHQKEALGIFRQLSKSREIAESELGIGRLYGKMHHLTESNQLLLQLLAAQVKAHNVQGQVTTLMTLAYVKGLNRQFPSAYHDDQQADGLLRGQPVSPDNFILAEHMGEMQERLGNQKKALEHYEVGISGSDQPRFASWHISLLRRAAELWDRLGDHATAGMLHQQSVWKARQFKLPEAEVRSQMSLAMSERDNNVISSITHLKNALLLSQSIGSNRLTAEIFNSLSDLYLQQAHYKEALSSLQAHQRMVDSLQTVDSGHKLALLEGSYELAENKIHIQNLEFSNREKTDQRNAGLIILISLAGILGVITFYYQKTKGFNRQLSQANVTKDRLFSIIGHDLRNPITGIVQLLDMIDDEGLDREEYHHMIALMRMQGKNTLEILNALLKWGETQFKGVQVAESTFSPKLYVQRNLELLEKQLADKQLTPKVSVPEQIEAYGDVNHFDFIMRNLLSNAIKFSNPGGTIEIAAIPVKGNKISFTVQDFGKGISTAQQMQFRNANMDVSFGTKGEKGTGIGLLLSKEFARANGSMLSVKSAEGQGAAFSFDFKSA